MVQETTLELQKRLLSAKIRWGFKFKRIVSLNEVNLPSKENPEMVDSLVEVGSNITYPGPKILLKTPPQLSEKVLYMFRHQLQKGVSVLTYFMPVGLVSPSTNNYNYKRIEQAKEVLREEGINKKLGYLAGLELSLVQEMTNFDKYCDPISLDLQSTLAKLNLQIEDSLNYSFSITSMATNNKGRRLSQSPPRVSKRWIKKIQKIKYSNISSNCKTNNYMVDTPPLSD